VTADEVKRYLEPLGNVTVLVGDIAATHQDIRELIIHLIHLDVSSDASDRTLRFTILCAIVSPRI
jgi:hypothetical protein